MPSTWPPTVSSVVTTSSARPVIPRWTPLSGPVIASAASACRSLNRGAPRAPDIDAAEQEQPHNVDEVPVPGGELEAEMMARGHLAEEGAHEADREEDHPDDDVRAMKAGRHEECGAVNRVLEGERRVNVLVGLGDDEQGAEQDSHQEKVLEPLPVAFAQIVVGDVYRKARRHQHEGVHQRQLQRIDHLRALRGPDAAREVETAVDLGIARIDRRAEERPEPGDEEHHFRCDEQDHSDCQAVADDRMVVAGLGLDDDVAPPGGHGEEDARAAEREHERAPTDSMHEHDEADRGDERERGADDRPRARLDEMKSWPGRHRRVSHRFAPYRYPAGPGRTRDSPFDAWAVRAANSV